MSVTFSWSKPNETLTPAQCGRTESAQIVIVGAGQAGICAARAAAEGGSSVICLDGQIREKQFFLGIGVIGHINSKWQKRRGIAPVDVDEFVNEWQICTSNRSDYRLIRRFAEHSGECFDWLTDCLTEEERDGIKAIFDPVSPNFPVTVNGMHSHAGAAYLGMPLQKKVLQANIAKAEEAGARFFYETRGLQVVMENGRAAGVIAEDADGKIFFRAEKGVVLAAGDYSRNRQMCLDLLSECADLIDEGADFSGYGWDGSGIQMGVWAGGRIDPRPHAGMGGNYAFPGFGSIGSAAVLRVNKYGERYSNEGFYNHIWAAFTGARQPNGMLWGIFDSTICEQLTHQPCNHGSIDYTNEEEMENLRKSLEKARAAKGGAESSGRDGVARRICCGETLPELAEQLFSDEKSRETFLASVERYNELCHAGTDPDFGKDPALLLPIEHGPFYACGQEKNSAAPGAQSLNLLVTVSGLMINHRQQVLGEDFEPVPGLYATGNNSGCRFGSAYATCIPGESISMANTMGMLIGQDLTKN